MSAPSTVLFLNSFGAAFGDTVVLADVSCAVGPGVNLLMGPAGAGKSTLLRSLAGFNDAQPSFRTWGEAVYQGAPLVESERRPALVAQKARLVMATVLENIVVGLPERHRLTRTEQADLARGILERHGQHELARRLDEPVVNLPLATQRVVAILRTAAADPALLCVDEPTAGLPDDDRIVVIDVIRRLAEERSVLMVTHNQRVARAMGGQMVLLTGGRVQEAQPIKEFLKAPITDAGRSFVTTGSCSVPSPSAAREALDPDVEPPPPLPSAATASSTSTGPRGFHWVLRGQLAGVPRPGLVADTDNDLAGLRDVGVTMLVCLEEKPTVPTPLLARYGITGLYFPIEDMRAPPLAEAAKHCQLVERLVARGEVVCVHCRAGLGRTGTMLACQLIWRGVPALDALETVRAIQPRWVQSDEQVEFLIAFAQRFLGKGDNKRPKRVNPTPEIPAHKES